MASTSAVAPLALPMAPTTRAISRTPAPAPPCAFGTANPSSPASDNSRQFSTGTVAARACSRARSAKPATRRLPLSMMLGTASIPVCFRLLPVKRMPIGGRYKALREITTSALARHQGEGGNSPALQLLRILLQTSQTSLWGAKRRGTPESANVGALDYFAALAMTAGG